MNDGVGAGMVRGWVMLWNLELAWLLAVVVIGVSILAFLELITSLQDERGPAMRESDSSSSGSRSYSFRSLIRRTIAR